MRIMINMTSNPIDNVPVFGTLKGLCAYGSLCGLNTCLSM